MEAKSKREDYQSKFPRAKHNFHHGGSNRFNAYGRSSHRHGNFTPKRRNRVGNFSSYAKSYGHTSCDDYGGVTKIEIMKPSMIEEFSKINELPQAQEVFEESIVNHVVEETSNEDSCDDMNERRIANEECNELKEKERVEKKERLNSEDSKVLRSNIEGFASQVKVIKLFSMCSISKDQLREQFGGKNGQVLKESYPTAGSSPWPTVADRLHRHNTRRFYNIYFNMQDAFHPVQRMQQALKGLEQQFSCLAKDVKDLKREENQQSSRRDFGRYPMYDNQ
ncbi:hypothetical protein M9H77_16728 [Catharanthus roseus]|uniref:Uncharacterized protein n=1 Tax=Catharanthus roseus TaxID=4058 RepID=A0ACC0B2J7_CATRO|nr:hypothetical protein M9H77_16728 [Catharanthus roseus]